MGMSLLLGVLFFSALACSAILTAIVRAAALRTGFVDKPGPRKIHASEKPYGGGIAIYVTLVTIVGVGYLLAAKIPIMEPYIAGMTSEKVVLRLLTIFFGATAIFALGLIDDLRQLSPFVKLGVQLAVALATVFIGGIRISLFVEAEWFGSLLAVLWILILTNAFNLLDNMDGLSAGIGLVASFLLFFVAGQNGQLFIGAILAAVGGGLAGFLLFNFPPAKIFLGDSGSLLIGYLLSTLTVMSTYFSYHGNANILAIVMPLLILALPIYDTASVIWLRIKSGKPIMVGDKNHFSHRIMRLGFSTRETVLTIYLVALCLGMAAVLLNQLDFFGSIITLLQCGGIFVVLVILERLPNRTKGHEDAG